MLQELDEITKDIYRKYRPALRAIGVDLGREDVQEAIINCYSDMEAIFQRVIEYWLNLQNNHQKIEYPSALLIEALNNHWQPRNWREEYLNDKRLKSPCLIWWEEAGKIWGEELRNQLIADVNETDNGAEYILLTTGEKINLKIANLRGWDWLLKYAQEQKETANKNSFSKIGF